MDNFAQQFDDIIRDVVYDTDMTDEQKQAYVTVVFKSFKKFAWCPVESEFFTALPVYFAYEEVYGRLDDNQC